MKEREMLQIPQIDHAKVPLYGNILELLSKISLIGVGTCYAVGFFVVNIHFAQFGSSADGIFELAYMTAGVWVMLTIFVGTIFLYGIRKIWRERTKMRGRFGWIMVLGLWIVMYIGVVAFFASAAHVRISNWQGFAALFSALNLILYTSSMVSKFISETKFDWFDRIISTIYVGGLAITFLFLFSKFVYSGIPNELGGGRLRLIQMIPNTEYVESYRSYGLVLIKNPYNLSNDTTRDVDLITESVRLLQRNENIVVFLLGQNDQERAISISMNQVNAVIYQHDDY